MAESKKSGRRITLKFPKGASKAELQAVLDRLWPSMPDSPKRGTEG